MKLKRLSRFSRAVVLLLTLSLTSALGTAQATLPVPDGKAQQSAMLTRFYYQTAIEAASRGGLDLSSDMMEKVYGLNRNSIAMALVYAELLEQGGYYQKALELYKNIAPDYPEPMSQSLLQYRMGLAYEHLRDFTAATDAFEHAIALYPDKDVPAHYYYDLGVVYAKQNRFDQTQVYSQKAVDRAPGFAEAWNNLGYSLARLGQLEEAYAAVQKALALTPDNPNALDSMGYILFQQGQLEEAARQFEKATTIDPAMADSFLYLGKSYERLQQWDKAIAAYDLYLKTLTPDSMDEKSMVMAKLTALQEERMSQTLATPEPQGNIFLGVPADSLPQQTQATPESSEPTLESPNPLRR